MTKAKRAVSVRISIVSRPPALLGSAITTSSRCPRYLVRKGDLPALAQSASARPGDYCICSSCAGKFNLSATSADSVLPGSADRGFTVEEDGGCCWPGEESTSSAHRLFPLSITHHTPQHRARSFFRLRWQAPSESTLPGHCRHCRDCKRGAAPRGPSHATLRDIPQAASNIVSARAHTHLALRQRLSRSCAGSSTATSLALRRQSTNTPTAALRFNPLHPTPRPHTSDLLT